MQIVVNGSDVTTNATTLSELVRERGHEASAVATALNGEFIRIARRPKKSLSQGDAIEIVAARQGG
jgi:sulfur carrier protein